MDVASLDATVSTFYGTKSKEERAAAHSILLDLQTNQDMWLQVVHILSNTQSLSTKYFALQVLEGVIKYKWKALPVAQRHGMRNYISEVIVTLSSDENSFRMERLYVNKLNIILVQILKHEWPARWLGFIPDLAVAAQTSETICENCMTIVKLLSEEVFHFLRGEMTQQKIDELQRSLSSEATLFFVELRRYAWVPSRRPELIRATLELDTLQACFSWIPPCYVFEFGLIENIIEIFPGPPAYRNLTLQCLIEIGALDYGILYENHFVRLNNTFIQKLQSIHAPTSNFKNLYANGNSEEQAFIKNVALFFTSFYKLHIQKLESSLENMSALLSGLDYLVNLSYVDDTEVFEVCLDFWNAFISELLKNVLQLKMRKTLIYLANLRNEDTEEKMLTILSEELNAEQWTLNNLCTLLCWSISSKSSGLMVKEQKNRFFEMVIRDLKNLCGFTIGEGNKAVIASNIMYVVGRSGLKLLKFVLRKLFEFMHEPHLDVQDMAFDTVLKIMQECNRKFVIVQVGENEPVVSELLRNLPTIIAYLKPNKIHSFYELVGNMIQAVPDPQRRDEYLQRLMELPNQEWAYIMEQAHQSEEYLKDPDVVRAVLNNLQTNTSAATSLGTLYHPWIHRIFEHMLMVYVMYSELISTNIAQGGPYASKTSVVKLLRSVRRETLTLIETFLDKAEDQSRLYYGQFVQHLINPVFHDYAQNLPDAREPEVLSLFATIINKYRGAMLNDFPQILEIVFQCTLEMINKNFEDYLEHRLKFFSLLRAIVAHCFPALIHLSGEQLKLVMDSIIWAFRHTERNIAETGLDLLLEMLKKFQPTDSQFYRTYFLTIQQEIFAVLTDTFHKAGFKLHVLALQCMFCQLESMTEPLWDAATVPRTYQNNSMFVRESTIKLLSTSFPNMTTDEVTQFVTALFESRSELPEFTKHIRDFLVHSKEFSAQYNKDLYAERAAAQREMDRQRMLSIPGLIISPAKDVVNTRAHCTKRVGEKT